MNNRWASKHRGVNVEKRDWTDDGNEEIFQLQNQNRLGAAYFKNGHTCMRVIKNEEEIRSRCAWKREGNEIVSLAEKTEKSCLASDAKMFWESDS